MELSISRHSCRLIEQMIAGEIAMEISTENQLVVSTSKKMLKKRVARELFNGLGKRRKGKSC